MKRYYWIYFARLRMQNAVFPIIQHKHLLPDDTTVCQVLRFLFYLKALPRPSRLPLVPFLTSTACVLLSAPPLIVLSCVPVASMHAWKYTVRGR